MEIYLPALTFGRALQAAAEFGITVDELVAEATHEHLKRMASEMFEREFRAEQEEAARTMKPHVYRTEYAAAWRPPSWSKDAGGPAPR